MTLSTPAVDRAPEWDEHLKRKGWCQSPLMAVPVDEIPANEGPPETPEEQKRRKLMYAMEGKPPTEKQMRFLRVLGHDGEVFGDRADVSRLIDRLKAKRDHDDGLSYEEWKRLTDPDLDDLDLDEIRWTL